jgi:hypothetical protein
MNQIRVLFPLCFLLFLFAPLMALSPRSMAPWLILFALGCAPIIHAHWREIKQQKPHKALLFLPLALLLASVSMVWSPSPRALETMIDLLYPSIAACLILVSLPFINPALQKKMLDYFSAGWAIGFTLLCIEIFFDHPIHRWFNHVGADVDLSESNVPKRMIGLFTLAIWPLALLIATCWKRIVGIMITLVFLKLQQFF